MPITFPLSPLTPVVEIALGVDPASDPAGWSWTNITSFVRYEPRIVITKGRRDESSTVDPASARLTLDNRDGRFCRRNPMGAYYGQLSKNTPIRIGVNPGDGVNYRFHGFVNEWPTRWTKDARDSTVPVTCSGILRRLARNRKLGTVLFRAMSGIAANGYVPLAYWPMEDGTAATRFANAVAGGSPMAITSGVSAGQLSTLPGSASLPTFSSGTTLRGDVPAYVDPGKWITQQVIFCPASPDNTLSPMRVWMTDGSSVTAGFDTTGNGLQLALRAADGSLTGAWSTGYDPARTEGQWTSLVVASQANESGATDGLHANLYDTSGSLIASISQLVSATSHQPVSYVQPGGAFGTQATGTGYGHVGVYATSSWVIGTDDVYSAQAAGGYIGEDAGDRMTRVCREEGVSFTTAATRTATMGAQPNGTLLDVLRECEAADMGLLYENQFGLGYLSLVERYNMAATLVLDFNSGDVAEPPEPADDDQQTVNSYTVSRTSGSSATAEDATSIAADGLYAGTATLNVSSDSQLPDIAAWRVHMGTVDEDRWPAIPIRLARTPNRITAWEALAIGGRMTVANPPDQGSPDSIDAVVEGWTETITPNLWEAVLNTSPFSPFRIAKIAGGARVNTTTSTLSASVTTTATSLSVATTGSLWTTTATFPADFNFDIVIEGERITVGAITGTSSPQTFTVTRSINGVVKAHNAGAVVQLFTPYYVGL